MKIQVLIVKAFTKDSEKGNPAGVIVDARELNEAQMLSIASALGFSESAFVFPSDKASFRVRFFTPTKEVPLCGHGTIATFFALVQEGKVSFQDQTVVISSQETSAGILPVTCHQDGLIVMEQAKPMFYDTAFNKNEIATLLGLNEADIKDWPIQLVSTGSPKLMIPVKSLSHLERIKPNLEAMKQFCANSEVRGFYPFTQQTLEGSDFHARQFNPFAGIDEDPVTGVAAGALGAYVVHHRLLNKNEIVVEQGYFLGKGGKMFVKVEGQTVTVGGYAVIAERRELSI